jgi:hypothetical protein
MMCLGPSPTDRCPTGTLVAGSNPRCRACRAARATAALTAAGELAPPTPTRDRAADTALLAAWREQVGDYCPGDETLGLRPHGAHHSLDLTVHHPVALAAGGLPDQPGLRILCRSRNSALGVTLGQAPPSPVLGP